jgi:hypothetical protein
MPVSIMTIPAFTLICGSKTLEGPATLEYPVDTHLENTQARMRTLYLPAVKLHIRGSA